MEQINKLKRGCSQLLTMILLVLLFLCSLLCLVIHSRPTRASEQPGLDVMLVIDHSNSMEQPGGKGSDPQRLRLDAAGLLITYLGLESYDAYQRLGLIYFGGQSQLVQPLTSLAEPTQRERLRQTLSEFQLMDWTDHLGALQKAYAELYESDRALSQQHKAVILLTDGQPATPALTTPEARAVYIEELRELVQRFADHNCPIFTIAITADAIAPDPNLQTFYRNLWQEIAATTPPAAYYELHTASDLPQVYHDISIQLLGTTPTQPVTELQVQGTLSATIPVESDLSRVVLTIFKHDPAIRIQLRRPGGALVRLEDPDVQRQGEAGQTHDEMWAITNPQAGLWMMEMSGQGNVLIWKDSIPIMPATPARYKLEFVTPSTYVPAEQPLPVRCRVLDAQGAYVPEARSFQITVELKRAGFSEALLLTRPDEGGIYNTSYPNLLAGAYTLRGRVLAEGQEVTTLEKAFEAIPLPHLEVGVPAVNQVITAGYTLPISLAVTAGFQRLDAATLQQIGTLITRLEESSRGGIPVPLKDHPDGYFIGQVQIPERKGTYALALHLQGTTPEGLPFEEDQRIPLQMMPPAQPPTPIPWLPILPLIACIGLTALLLKHKALHTPHLEGHWRVLTAPSEQAIGQIIPLPTERNMISLGGQGKNALTLPMTVHLDAIVAILQANRNFEGGIEIWINPAGARGTNTLRRNGQLVLTPQRLQDGDVIATDAYTLRYENIRQAAARRAGTAAQKNK